MDINLGKKILQDILDQHTLRPVSFHMLDRDMKRVGEPVLLPSLPKSVRIGPAPVPVYQVELWTGEGKEDQGDILILWFNHKVWGKEPLPPYSMIQFNDLDQITGR